MSDTEINLRARFDDLDGKKALDSLVLESGLLNPKPATGGSPNPSDPSKILEGMIGGGPVEKKAAESSFLGSLWEGTKSIASDVGTGLYEAPRQIAGGVMDAGQAMLDLTDWLGDKVEKVVPTGAVQFFNKKGEWDFKYVPAGEVDTKETGLTLPTTDEPKSVTGGLVRGAAQFLAGWGAVGKVAPALTGGKTVAGVVGKSMARGAAADFTAFGAHEERLSNLIESYPDLKNPVTAYLAADPNDTEMEGRFKNSLEGLGLGALTEGMFRAVKAIKANRAAKAAEPGAAADRAAEAARGSAEERPGRGAEGEIGPDPEDPLVASAKDFEKMRDRKMRKAVEETEIGTTGVSRETPTGPKGAAATAEFTRKVTGAVDDIAEMGYEKLGDSDKYFNPEKIDGPDDIKAILQFGAKAFREEVEDAQRGTRSHGTTKAAADKIDAWKVLMERDGASALNAEELTAARELWISSGDRLLQLSREAVKNPSTENLFRARHMLAVFHAIQKEYMGARTEVARALNAMKIPVGSNVKKLADIEAMVEQFGGTEATVKVLAGIVEAEKNGGRAAVSAIIEKSAWAKSADVGLEIWINALLSGPKTHLVNIMSNATVMANHAWETAVASRIARTMGDDTAVAVGEASAYWAGVRGSLIDAFRNSAKTFTTGSTGYGMGKIELPFDRAISSTTWNIASESAYGRAIDAIGAVVNVPTRLLSSGDEFFKTMNYRGGVHEYAYRTARREFERTGGADLDISDILPPDVATSTRATRKGVSGELGGPRKTFEDRVRELINNPPDEVTMAATELAQINTFTNKARGPAGQVARYISALKNNEQSKVRYLAYMLMPFTRTPANIIDYAIFERGPLAMMTRRYKADISRGGADAYMARTKMALGTGVTLLALDWGLNGTVTGSGPTDWKEKAALRRMGWQPYSVKIGDRYYAYNRLDPIGTMLGMGADLAEIMRASDDMDEMTYDEWEQALFASTFVAAENVMNKTYLRGMSDFVGALNSPDRTAARYVENLAGTVIPSIVRDAARIVDPVARQTNDLITTIKSRLPGFSDELPSRRDAYGREISYQSGLGLMWDVVSPIYSKKWDPEPIDEETRKDGWYVDKPPTYFRSKKTGGETVSLREYPHIYSRYVELRGATKPADMGEHGEAIMDLYGNTTMLETLNAIVGGKHELSPEYMEKTSAEDRENFIKHVVGKYQKAAQKILFDEYPEIIDIGMAKATRVAERRATNRRVLEGVE